MTNVEITVVLSLLTQLMRTQATPYSRIWDFMRMNPRTFHGNKVDEDTQGFIHEVFNVVDAMDVPFREKVKRATYQLKDVAQVWFEKWTDERPLRVGLVDWEVF